MSNIARLTFLFALTVILIAVLCGSAAAQQQITGTLPDGATYVIDVPANWNGTLFLYSHGYVTPGAPNPAQDVGDPLTGGFMLAAGYALAGSSYATTGGQFTKRSRIRWRCSTYFIVLSELRRIPSPGATLSVA